MSLNLVRYQNHETLEMTLYSYVLVQRNPGTTKPLSSQQLLELIK